MLHENIFISILKYTKSHLVISKIEIPRSTVQNNVVSRFVVRG